MATLKFGIIGVGHFGKNYVRLLREIEGVELTSTANNREEAEKLLGDPEIDCLIIASPASTHFAYAKQGIEGGKHVLVEKPMTVSVPEARELVEVVQKNDQIFMVAHQYLYNDYIRELKGQLGRGIVGNVRYLFAEHFYFGVLRSDSGAFWDAAPHELAILDYLFGPLKIDKTQGSSVTFPKSMYDDFVVAEVRFGGGLFMTLVVSRYAPYKSRKMIIAGDQGFAVFDEREEDPLRFILSPYPDRSEFRGRSSLFLNQAQARLIVPHIQTREPLRNQLEHFLDCVRSNHHPLTDVRHGLRVIELLDFVYRKLVV